jgi:hypothetical protein
MKNHSSDITPALDGSARITVLNASGEAIQTVLFSDYLREHDMSEVTIALALDGETVSITHANPVFNHSVRLA